MDWFSTKHERNDLEQQIDALRREMAHLAKSVSRQGRHAVKRTSKGSADLYEEIAEHLVAALPVIRGQARAFERTVRSHPKQTVALAGFAVLGIAAAILFSRR
jgi:ElaB/YqjD/DUF883 family membrane-anchored ribosome-binding protein